MVLNPAPDLLIFVYWNAKPFNPQCTKTFLHFQNLENHHPSAGGTILFVLSVMPGTCLLPREEHQTVDLQATPYP